MEVKMLEKDAVLARIAELTKERDQMVADANARVMAYNVTISELEKIVNPKEEEEDGE